VTFTAGLRLTRIRCSPERVCVARRPALAGPHACGPRQKIMRPGAPLSPGLTFIPRSVFVWPGAPLSPGHTSAAPDHNHGARRPALARPHV